MFRNSLPHHHFFNLCTGSISLGRQRLWGRVPTSEVPLQVFPDRTCLHWGSSGITLPPLLLTVETSHVVNTRTPGLLRGFRNFEYCLLNTPAVSYSCSETSSGRNQAEGNGQLYLELRACVGPAKAGRILGQKQHSNLASSAGKLPQALGSLESLSISEGAPDALHRAQREVPTPPRQGDPYFLNLNQTKSASLTNLNSQTGWRQPGHVFVFFEGNIF